MVTSICGECKALVREGEFHPYLHCIVAKVQPEHWREQLAEYHKYFEEGYINEWDKTKPFVKVEGVEVGASGAVQQEGSKPSPSKSKGV